MMDIREIRVDPVRDEAVVSLVHTPEFHLNSSVLTELHVIEYLVQLFQSLEVGDGLFLRAKTVVLDPAFDVQGHGIH